MNTNEKQLSATELVAVLHNSPDRIVGRMSYQEQKTLLGRVVLGEATITAPVGAALLTALLLEPSDVAKAIDHVEATRRRNIEGRKNWERLQVIEAGMKEPLAALTAKAVELFGEDYEVIRPPVFEVDYQRDCCTAGSPALAPLAEAVSAAMTGRYEVARFALMIEDQVTCGDLFGLADRRRELAADAARRAS